MTGDDLTDTLAISDRHALTFGFNTTFGSSGYESKLRSLVAQASSNPTLAVERVSESHGKCRRGRIALVLMSSSFAVR